MSTKNHNWPDQSVFTVHGRLRGKERGEVENAKVLIYFRIAVFLQECKVEGTKGNPSDFGGVESKNELLNNYRNDISFI